MKRLKQFPIVCMKLDSLNDYLQWPFCKEIYACSPSIASILLMQHKFEKKLTRMLNVPSIKGSINSKSTVYVIMNILIT